MARGESVRAGPRPCGTESGFTLLEVLITGFVFAILVTGIGLAVISGYRVAGNMEGEHAVYSQALTMLNAVTELRFGRPGEAVPTSAQVTEVLDSDTFSGDVSLTQLHFASPIDFELSGFPIPGRWRLLISTDLNGDGDTDDTLEGNPDLLRIAIYHEGSLVLSAVRSAPTALEEQGEANPIFGPPPPSDTTPSAEDIAAASGVTVTVVGFQATYFDVPLGPTEPGVREEETAE